jgi:hypothetical protein
VRIEVIALQQVRYAAHIERRVLFDLDHREPLTARVYIRGLRVLEQLLGENGHMVMHAFSQYQCVNESVLVDVGFAC